MEENTQTTDIQPQQPSILVPGENIVAPGITFQRFAEVVTGLQSELIRTQQQLVAEQAHRIRLLEGGRSESVSDTPLETKKLKDTVTIKSAENEFLKASVASLATEAEGLRRALEERWAQKEPGESSSHVADSESEKEFADEGVDGERVREFGAAEIDRLQKVIAAETAKARLFQEAVAIKEGLHAQTVADLEARVEALEASLVSKVAEIERLTAKKPSETEEAPNPALEMVAEIQRLQQAISIKDSEAERYRQTVTTLEGRGNAIEQTLKEALYEIEQLNQDKMELGREYARVKRELHSTQLSIVNKKVEIADLKRVIASQEEHIAATAVRTLAKKNSGLRRVRCSVASFASTRKSSITDYGDQEYDGVAAYDDDETDRYTTGTGGETETDGHTWDEIDSFYGQSGDECSEEKEM